MDISTYLYDNSFSKEVTIRLIKSYYKDLNTNHKPQIALSLYKCVALDIKLIVATTNNQKEVYLMKYLEAVKEVSDELGSPASHLLECIGKKVFISFIGENKEGLTHTGFIDDFLDGFTPSITYKVDPVNLGFIILTSTKRFKVNYSSILEIKLIENSTN